MEPIRVLHIVGIMNMGGTENFIMNVYRNIDRNKIQFDFLITREEKGIFDEEIVSLGGKIYNIPKMELIGYNRYSKLLYKFFKNHTEYRIVHCHRDALCAIYLKQAKKAGIRTRIAHSHSTNIIEKNDYKGKLKAIIKNIFKNHIIKYATNFFACGEEAGVWLFGKSLDKENLVVINNGIELQKYIYNEGIANNKRKELGIDKDTFLMGHVGRFDIVKNHKFIVEIIEELKNKIDDFKVCLVGDGILKNEIIDLTKKYGIEDKFLFLGIRDDINELMMAFDLFLFPSLFEGLGIVLIEAQATGLRCIVSDGVVMEADMNLDLLKNISIDSIKEWTDFIIKYYNNFKTNIEQRFSMIDNIMNKGYDIHNTTNYLTKFYIDSYNLGD